MPKDKSQLVEIAKVYVSLRELYGGFRPLWPEDDNAIDECLRSLELAASQFEPKNSDECIAALTIARSDYYGPHSSEGLLDVMGRRALDAGKLML